MLRKALLAAAASERIGRVGDERRRRARAVVDRYVAGESSEDAVAVARALRSAGLLVTLDYLGEDTTDAQRAAATAAQYVHLLGKLAAEGLTEGGAVEVSVKPTAVGLLLGTRARPSLANGDRAPRADRRRGARRGHDRDGRRRGPQDHRRRAADRRPRCGPGSRSVGSVVQASLRRTEADVRELAAPGVRVRLCKGAYAEPAVRGVRRPARRRQVVRALPAHPDGRARATR